MMRTTNRRCPSMQKGAEYTWRGAARSRYSRRMSTTGEKLRQQLTELSRNLWWAWNPQIIKLFRDLDPETFRSSNHNPVSVLANFPSERFETIASDAVMRARVDSAYRELGDYLGAAR